MIETPFLHKIKSIHFVGIGGIGMSGIAEVLLNMGFEISGSDIKKSETTERLEKLGAKIFYGHNPENVVNAHVVVVSSAIKQENPEVQKAKELLIPVIPRAEMLAELMKLKFSIAIAGAHGKTTTTSLIASVLAKCGLDPTYVVGGKLKSIGTNARLGSSRYLVVEADESDGTFLLLFPTFAVVTNIDLEHLDFYRNLNEIKEAFLKFLNSVPFYGVNIICIDNENLLSLIPFLKRRYVTYGLSKRADFRAENIRSMGLKVNFRVLKRDEEIGEVTLALPGIHNVVNALAACVCGDELGIPFEYTKKALEEFSGIQRRFEIKLDGKIKIIDDYAHHPTEIKSTLKTIRELFDGRIVVIFQPHRYTRTKALFDEFVFSFNEADILIINEIYPASEEKIEGVDGLSLAKKIKTFGLSKVFFASTLDEAFETAKEIVRDGDIVVTLGAGDIYKVADRLKELWS